MARDEQAESMAWAPQACTLPTAEQPWRVREFDDLLASSVRPAERVEPTWLRVHLPAGDDVVATARDLTAREVRCCSFFSFALHPTAAATVLEVRVPQTQTAVLDALEQMTRAGGSAAARRDARQTALERAQQSGYPNR